MPRRSPILALVLLACLPSLGLFQAASATAQQPAPITLSVRAGFDGYYKDGRWLPIRVTIANDGPDARGTLRVIAPRNDQVPVAYTREVELPTQSRREFFMYIPVEGYVSRLDVTLVSGNTELAQDSARLTQVQSSDLLFGVLAGSPSAYNFLSNVDPLNGAAYVAQVALADLPPAEHGWQPLDVLIVSDVDTGALTPEQRAALAGWVAGGGRLIVAGGPGWQKTAAGLGALLPLIPSGAQTVGDLSALLQYAPSIALGPGEAVLATGPLASGAVTWASTAAGLPLVVSQRTGFGQVVFLAADPAFAPLKGWDGLEAVFRYVMSFSAERPSWAVGIHNWSSAREAVTALPGLNLPSTWQICGFLSLYILLIGPLNYLVLRRLKRREWAWFTIPGIVIAFSAVTYLTGYQLRGTQATLHQLSVVQVWPGQSQARVDTVVGLFSPRRTGYDVEFPEGFAARPIPSDGSYGLVASGQFEQSDHTRAQDVRVDVGAVQAFVAQGQTPAPQFNAALTLDIASSTPALAGTVTNQSQLTLKNAVVLGPGAAQTLGDFAPGETKPVSLMMFNTRAMPAPANAISPYLPPLSSGFAPMPPPYYGSGYDRTIDDILGNSNYYSDKESYRRYSLLSSVVDAYSGNARGSGVYLVGWVEATPASARVVNRNFKTVDEAVYFVALQPTLSQSSGALTIPPGLMNWMVLDPGQMGAPTPYDMYLYQGSDYALRFTPAQAVAFRRVQRLTLHITSYGASGLLPIRIYLWDFTEGAWAEQANLYWGDNAVAFPERFTDASGEVRVRVAYTGPTQWSVEAVDCTLVVQP